MATAKGGHEIIHLTYRWDGEKSSWRLRKPKVLIAMQTSNSNVGTRSVGSLKMLNAILYMTQSAIAQEFGSRENFWSFHQRDRYQDLTVEMGLSELSYFMWGTRRRVSQAEFAKLADVLKELEYIAEGEGSCTNPRSNRVFGYISVPKGKNTLTVTFRPSQCEAYFHPNSHYTSIRLESMFKLRSVWACLLLEVGARCSQQQNKRTKGYCLESWYQRAMGTRQPITRKNNVLRAMRLACLEIERLFDEGLCDFTVQPLVSNGLARKPGLIRFEAHVPAERPTYISPQPAERQQVSTSKDSESAHGMVNKTAMSIEYQTTPLILSLVERLGVKADVARDVLKKYGRDTVEHKFKALASYLKENPKTLRNPAGFFLRYLDGTVNLGENTTSIINIEALASWAKAEERKSKIADEQADETRRKSLMKEEQVARAGLLEEFKQLPLTEQQRIQAMTLESLRHASPIRKRVEQNRYHALVVATYKELLQASKNETCCSA